MLNKATNLSKHIYLLPGSCETHMDKGTYPKDLCYAAKANIFPDEEFKNNIRALRKVTKQKFIGALTRFHCHCVERNPIKLRRAKSYKLENDTNKNTNQERIEECHQSNAHH